MTTSIGNKSKRSKKEDGVIIMVQTKKTPGCKRQGERHMAVKNGVQHTAMDGQSMVST